MSSVALTKDELSLKYKGAAFDSHAMVAKDLASALLNFSAAVNTASKTINKSLSVELKVTAQKEGSFDVFLLLQNTFAAAGDFSQTPVGRGMEFLVELGIPAALVGAIRLVQNRLKKGEPTVKSSSVAQSNGLLLDERVTVTYPDGTRVETSRLEVNMSEDADFINHLGKAFTAPQEDGFDGVDVTTAHDSVSINAHEALSMREYVPTEDILGDDMVEYIVQPLSASFEDHKKWRLLTADGSTISAELADIEFYQRIENGLRIGKKNALKIRMHVITSRDKNGHMKNTYTAVKVLEYMPFEPVVTQGELF